MSNSTDALHDAILQSHTPEAPVLAVLDGAHFDNLPDALRAGEFFARSLYIDRGENNPDQVITAPHLVLLDEQSEDALGRTPDETLPALLALIEDRPAAVFWQCTNGADALFRHLRGINMVHYPKSALPPAEVVEDEETEATPDTHELVLFRHADANVMAQMLIAADSAEKARLFGPAMRVFFRPSKDWAFDSEVVTQAAGQDWPAATPGTLRLSEATAARLADTRSAQMHGKIRAYLKEAAPDQTSGLSDDQLSAHTRTFMSEATDYGVTSEAGMGRWCYLQIATDGGLSKDPKVHQFMTTPEPGLSPDRRVKLLLREAAAALEDSKA